jgi:ABC-type branched-subunit amino acid transport system ATPase component
MVLDLIDFLIQSGERIGVLVVEQQLFRLTGRIDRYYVMSQGHVIRHGDGPELWTLSPEELWSLH